MKRDERPYVARCAFCEQGLLRLMRCPCCDTVAAVCDECELIWSDVGRVHAEPASGSSSSFPVCPCCRASELHWSALDREEIQAAGLASFVAGESV